MVGNDDDDRKGSKSNGCRRMFEEVNKRFSSSTTQNMILVCVVFVEFQVPVVSRMLKSPKS